MTITRTVAAGLMAACLASLAAAAHAAVLAPLKGYVKPNEPVEIRFLDETPAGKKAFDKIGLPAAELSGLFTPAPAADVLGADHKIAFQLYTFDGKKLDPQSPEKPAINPDGSLDLATFFPQIDVAGTYILAWKDAPPLVIETLDNAIPWDYLMAKVPADQRPATIAQIRAGGPVVTHIELLLYAVITTDKGVIKAKFAYDVAPRTVDNFISLADQKFYDGSAFHRVMSGFMIQGGDSLANVAGREGTGGPGYNVAAEFSDKKHERGTLSMARTGLDMDTAGSQFFIIHERGPSAEYLDGKYTAFGDVIDDAGLKVVDAIAATPSDAKSGLVSGPKPQIESIRALPATLEIYGIKN